MKKIKKQMEKDTKTGYIKATVTPTDQCRDYEHGLMVKFSDKVAELVMDDLSDRVYSAKLGAWVIPEDRLSELVDVVGRKHLDIDSSLVNLATDISGYRFVRPLYWYQAEAVKFGLKKKNLLLCDEQGLGKTTTSIALVETMYVGKDVKVLVVCPNMVKGTWRKEIPLNSTRSVTVAEGNKRTDVLKEWVESGKDYCIINHDMLRSEVVKKLVSGKVDVMIVDEIHILKNSKCQKGKALGEYDAKHKIALTGTPIANKPIDLYNILKWLDVVNCSLPEFDLKYLHSYRCEDSLHKMLTKIMIRRTKAILDLPEKHYQTVIVDMPKKMEKQYDEARKNLLKILDKHMNASNFLTRVLRLRQVTGAQFLDNVYDVKLEKIQKIVAEKVEKGEKVIVIASWKVILAKYAAALEKYSPAVITGDYTMNDRMKEIERFQADPDCKVMIGNYPCLSVGLNLTAASTMILSDKPWTPAEIMQAEDRIHRIGQTKDVTIISLIANDTIDKYMSNMLNYKKEDIRDIVDACNTNYTDDEKNSFMAQVLGISKAELKKKLRKAS